MLAVQTSRRAGQLERALDWVILWLKALGDKITTHMAEPVSLWVKTKTDAARNSEEDVRLRYRYILINFVTKKVKKLTAVGMSCPVLSCPGTGHYTMVLVRTSLMRE